MKNRAWGESEGVRSVHGRDVERLWEGEGRKKVSKNSHHSLSLQDCRQPISCWHKGRDWDEVAAAEKETWVNEGSIKGLKISCGEDGENGLKASKRKCRKFG